jgi:hypothetical protein
MSEYAEFIRRWAWAISLGGALLGTALVLPWFTDPISWATLVTVLLGWLGIYVVVRIGARGCRENDLPQRAVASPRLPDSDRAERIGEFGSYPESRAFAELLIDCEEDRTLRAVLVDTLRESERLGPSWGQAQS